MAPNASHDHAGCRRRGDHRNSSAIDEIISTSASGHRASRHACATVVVADPLADGVTEREHRERDDGEQAGGECQHDGPPVLLHGGTVLLDAVEAVERPLHLSHQAWRR